MSVIQSVLDYWTQQPDNHALDILAAMILNRWITAPMSAAGVDVMQYMPYTTCHASASKALHR